MFASIVTISGSLPHWYGEICCCSYVVVVVTPGGLPACSGGFRGNMTYIIVVTFGGLPACYGGRCCCRCCKSLFLFLANVSRSGSIVVVGEPIFANVSGFGVVVVLVDRLRANDFTEARAPKWAKVIKLPRRDAHAATPSLNNNIVYRIYCLFNSHFILGTVRIHTSQVLHCGRRNILPLRGRNPT